MINRIKVNLDTDLYWTSFTEQIPEKHWDFDEKYTFHESDGRWYPGDGFCTLLYLIFATDKQVMNLKWRFAWRINIHPDFYSAPSPFFFSLWSFSPVFCLKTKMVFSSGRNKIGEVYLWKLAEASKSEPGHGKIFFSHQTGGTRVQHQSINWRIHWHSLNERDAGLNQIGERCVGNIFEVRIQNDGLDSLTLEPILNLIFSAQE